MVVVVVVVVVVVEVDVILLLEPPTILKYPHPWQPLRQFQSRNLSSLDTLTTPERTGIAYTKLVPAIVKTLPSVCRYLPNYIMYLPLNTYGPTAILE